MTEFNLIPKAIFHTDHSSKRPATPPNRRCVFYAWDLQKMYFVDTSMEWVELEFTVPDHTHDASDIVSGILDADRIPDELPGKNVTYLSGYTAFDFAGAAHTHDAADIVTGELDLDRIPTDLIGKNADLLDGYEAADFSFVGHQHDAGDIVTGILLLARIPTPLTGKDADTVDGYHGSDLALVGHQHPASDIISGTIALARIPTTLTGISADMVDGLHAAAFATASHTHPASDIVSGTLSLSLIPTTLTGISADMVDGLHAAAFALAAHTHVHNSDLTGLQGGTTGQYYHLTAAEYAALGGGTQAANTVMSGPASGGAAAPTFRALVAADLPVMTGATTGAASTKGAVPIAAAGDQYRTLHSDGTWKVKSLPTLLNEAVTLDDYTQIAISKLALGASGSLGFGTGSEIMLI